MKYDDDESGKWRTVLFYVLGVLGVVMCLATPSISFQLREEYERSQHPAKPSLYHYAMPKQAPKAQ